jgi:NAD(P)-dependent dehydrogenase (short-subunit alcohol dehydrogenase family)
MSHPIDQIDGSRAKQLHKEHDGQMSSGRSRGDERFGTTEKQAAAILFLASDEASYVTGVTLPVAGGDLG